MDEAPKAMTRGEIIAAFNAAKAAECDRLARKLAAEIDREAAATFLRAKEQPNGG